jgi:predicted dehydrogenase
LLELGRGNLYEWGIHHIDVARFLLGEPETVYARLTRIIKMRRMKITHSSCSHSAM